MLVVVDTNVIVSGLLNPSGTPGAIVRLLPKRLFTPVYSENILAEYRKVLVRDRFEFAPDRVTAVLDVIIDVGHFVSPRSEPAPFAPDPGDVPFVLAARVASCIIVTGNLRHYPKRLGVSAVTPAAFFASLNL